MEEEEEVKAPWDSLELCKNLKPVQYQTQE